METTEDIGTYDRILKVTIEQIRENGVSSVKMREVANLANVNLASINYHFRTKESLLLIAINHLISEGMKQAISALGDDSVSAKQRIRDFLVTHVSLMNEFHGPIHHLMLSEHSTPKDMHGFHDSMSEMAAFGRLVSEISGIKEHDRVFLLSTQLLGAAMAPSFLAEKVNAFVPVRLPDVEEQIDLLLKRFSLSEH